MNTDNWSKHLSTINHQNFERLALQVFQYQVAHNKLYGEFVQLLGISPHKVTSIYNIPFLPIEFFKTQTVVTGKQPAPVVFKSSGTTQGHTSSHYVARPDIYAWSYTQGFEAAFGPVADYCILGLLPSYLEQGNSSLVYMVSGLIEQSNHPQSGFYLDKYEELANLLLQLQQAGQKTLLIGVTYALLDLAEQFPMAIPDITILETGGMKGRRKEMIREALHAQLKSAFQVPHIYSEYGMTELLSQAYTDGSLWFRPPAWMKTLVRDPYDPMLVTDTGAGALNIIDLANIDSCSFIATADLGKMHEDCNRFEVLGRLDHSDIRGCNLMVQ